ncbi:HNH endonuclease [Scrofimicrobium canadense]|uniref:HNH endonuclease n=1 Tax=Scrofimicrobium canadense TaxID=2652290 RepID=UPI00298D98EA|nr:HNH endonuclease [Scrofimicrobium canadense]
MSVKQASSRNGRGHRAYRRQQAALKARVKRLNLPCYWCGQPIDTDLPGTERMSFTADHPDALANGGRLVGQQLQPMHRSCNSRKGNREDIDLEGWAAS